MTFFITDLACNSVAARTTVNDFRDDRMNLGTYAERNANRATAYRTQNQHIRMVQVMRGGMIKALKAEALP